MSNRLYEGAAALAAALTERHASIACVESLTGGLATATLVAIPGISARLRGGIVAYQEDVKRELLGIALEDLPGGSVVSAPCAQQMLEGLARLIPSDVALSFTGNAGPEASAGQPVGRVYIGLRIGETYEVVAFDFAGDRASIREQAVFEGYRLLTDHLLAETSMSAFADF